MNMKTFAAIAAATVIGVMAGVSAQAQTVLTYNGASGGNWFAPGVWLDGTGVAVSWLDGSIAVITNVNVALNGDAVVAGFQVHMTGRYVISGTGKLTLGAGGIYKTGGNEFNIQNDGGLHLAASQSWTSEISSMICLDRNRAITAADGVTLTCDGGTQFRVNSGGGLSANTTILMTGNAWFSLAPNGSLGSSVIILDGAANNRLSADVGFPFRDGRLGRQLILRNGASMNIGAGGCPFDLPSIVVEAPNAQATSSITGGTLTFQRNEIALNVAQGAALQITAPLAETQDMGTVLRKTGDGTLTLNSAGTFTGGVAVEAGVARLAQPASAGPGAVTLASSTVLEITAGGAIANAITGGGSVVKSGSGTTTLTGANAYAGGTTLSGGTLRVDAFAKLGTGAVAIDTGAVLVLTASQPFTAPERARITGTGTVLAGAGAEIEWCDDYDLAGDLTLDAELGGTMEVRQLIGSGYIKTSPGKLRIAGTDNYSGAITVMAGVLEIGSTANLANGVTIHTEESGVVQFDSFAQDWAKITGTCTVALADGASDAINISTLPLILAAAAGETWTVSALSGSAELVKTGPGTVAIGNAAGFSGTVRVLDGTLRAADTMGSGMVTVSNGVFAAYGTGVVLNNAYTVAGGTLLADNGGSLGSGAITLQTGGTVAAANGGSLGSGAFAVSMGTLRMDAGGSAGTRSIALSGAGRVEVYDGAGFDNAAAFTIGGGALDFRATTTMGRGVTLTAETWFYATTPPGAAEPTVATLAGAITTTARSKLKVGGNGKLLMAGGGTFISGGEIFVQSSGDLTIVSNTVSVTGYAGLESGGKRLAVADGGRFEMIGDSERKLHAGYGNQCANAIVEVATGGVFFVKSGIEVKIGMNSAHCTFLINGGEAIIEDGGNFLFGTDVAASTGRLELVAGVLKTSRQLIRGAGVAAVAFKGGTLQSDGVKSYNPWIAANIPATVEGAGGTIDTRGCDMWFGSSGISGAGRLTVTGGGSVAFAQPSAGWAGGLALDHGDAVVSATNALGTGEVTVGTNALCFAANAFLPNAVLMANEGGCVRVEADVAGTVGSLTGGKVTKQGDGALSASLISEGMDIAIQAGEVKVEPIAGIVGAPVGVPAIWMDASVASSFTIGGANDVSRWYDRRTPGDNTGFFATNRYNRPLLVQGALNGLPVLDFGLMRWMDTGDVGTSGDNRMMEFKQTQANIRSVFWVIGSRNGGGFLLGDNMVNGSARHFHRAAGSSTYGSVPGDPLWAGAGQEKGIVRAGETWTNGVSVNGSTTGLSGNYDLVTWRISATDDSNNNTPSAIWFASCFAGSNGRLNGGQELAEVLIYTNRLEEADRVITETYLTRKWFPARDGAGLRLGTVSLDGAGAGFVNAWPAPMRMAELVINAADVYVAGAPGSVAADLLTVTAQGALDASRLAALTVGALNLQAGATAVAAFDSTGKVSTLHVTGNVTLPATANYTVSLTDAVKPSSSALLIAADGALLEPSGATVWTHVGAVSRASRVTVDAAVRNIWLSTPSGTLLLLQ